MNIICDYMQTTNKYHLFNELRHIANSVNSALFGKLLLRLSIELEILPIAQENSQYG